MILVAVSGAAGRMGRLVARTVAAADDLELHALYDPHPGDGEVADVDVGTDPEALAGADVVVGQPRTLAEPGMPCGGGNVRLRCGARLRAARLLG